MSPNDKRAVVILTLISLFVVSVVSVVMYQRYSRPVIGADNCVYTDKGLSQRAATEQTVLLIDQSEALTDGHVRGVLKYVETYILSDELAPPGSRVLMFGFSKDDFPERGQGVPGFRPILDICKPRQEGNPFSDNNRKIRDKFVRSFLQPLKESLEKELSKDIGQRSPILETLQFISRSQDVGAWDKRKKLIVISDMLQHTQGFTHYRPPNTYDDFKKRFSAQVLADFRSWEVAILYLRRYHDRHLQLPQHLEFWQRYFHDVGGKLAQIEGFD